MRRDRGANGKGQNQRPLHYIHSEICHFNFALHLEIAKPLSLSERRFCWAISVYSSHHHHHHHLGLPLSALIRDVFRFSTQASKLVHKAKLERQAHMVPYRLSLSLSLRASIHCLVKMSLLDFHNGPWCCALCWLLLRGIKPLLLLLLLCK